jgi:hypothetical protein
MFVYDHKTPRPHAVYDIRRAPYDFVSSLLRPLVLHSVIKYISRINKFHVSTSHQKSRILLHFLAFVLRNILLYLKNIETKIPRYVAVVYCIEIYSLPNPFSLSYFSPVIRLCYISFMHSEILVETKLFALSFDI